MLLAIVVGRVREKRVTEKTFSLNDYVRESLMDKIHKSRHSKPVWDVRKALHEANEQFEMINKRTAAKIIMRAAVEANGRGNKGEGSGGAAMSASA